MEMRLRGTSVLLPTVLALASIAGTGQRPDHVQRPRGHDADGRGQGDVGGPDERHAEPWRKTVERIRTPATRANDEARAPV